MLEDHAIISAVDLTGSPIIGRSGEPEDGQALVMSTGLTGGPVVVPVDLAYDGSELRTAHDKDGARLVYGPPREPAGFPSFACSPNNIFDDWIFNAFSDEFGRPDGPLGGSWLAPTASIVSSQAHVGTGTGAWTQNSFYPVYASMTTYPVLPHGGSTLWTWGFIIGAGASTSASTVSVNILTGSDPGELIRLQFSIFWGGIGGGTVNSPFINFANGYGNIATLFDNQAIKWNANSQGYASISYVGETFENQF